MNKKLNYEITKQYYKLAPRVSFSTYFVLAVTIYFFQGLLPSDILAFWSVTVFFMATLFLVVVRLFKHYGNEENAGTWLTIGTWAAVIYDIPLAFIGPMGFMVDDNLYQVLTLFMLAGMSAGAILTRGVVFKIYTYTIITLLAPTILILALHPTAIAKGMLLLALVFFFFLLSVARNYSSTIANNFQLWLDKEKLIGQLTQSHSELEKAKMRAERASEAKNQFLANVSHELRTPLNGIIGFSDLLQGQRLDKRGTSYAGQIGKSAQALLRIVNDILDISAIEAGHITLREEPFSIRNELNDVMDVLRPMAEHKGLILELNVSEDVVDGLYGDASRLRQIISNLITNAVKYTEKGNIKVDVRQKGEWNDQVIVCFDVEDTGIGITDETQATIFNNFTRGEGFETRRREGVGLGLAIVKSLLQRMGGRISVQSTRGEGSCFSCEVPFVRSTEMPQGYEREKASGLTSEQLTELKVLVVDDNDTNRMVLGAFLTKSGIPFDEVDDGYDAIERIRSDEFDVVLMDIQMPGISGIEVVRKLRNERVSLPVMVAVTAHAFPEQEQAILNAGFSYFLAKPVFEKKLMEVLISISRHNYEKRLKNNCVA